MGILMPKATAVWLIDNTSLTFEQIADFCGLHKLEVSSIADGEVAETMRGADPVAGGELLREEIKAGEADANYRLKQPLPRHSDEVPKPKMRKARYTPISRRSERPDAILWFLRNHAEITDAQIVRLIGTTRNMIEQIRKREHWNMDNIKPVDPVTLGLCSQIDLDDIVAEGAQKREKMERDRAKTQQGPGLQPLVDDRPMGMSDKDGESASADIPAPDEELSAQNVFADFGTDGPVSDGG